MMSVAPTRLKATTKDQNSGRILAVRSARNGQHSGCEVTVGGEGGEASGQIRAYDARKDKDEPKKSKAVQCSDCTLGIESIYRLEPGPNIDAEAKQPRDITQNELNSEEGF